MLKRFRSDSIDFIVHKMKKMKILKESQKYFATMGITRHQAMQCQQPFNAKNSQQLVKFCLFVIPFGGFLIFEANSFKEYTESICFTSAIIVIAIIFLAFIWNMRNFFNFVDGWEECVKQSE